MFKSFPKASRPVLLGLVIAAVSLFWAVPALAHHPFGGMTPTNAFQGFLSGLGHPVVGVDHVAFVVASGLVAALWPQGLVVPLAFVLCSMVGTGVHVLSWTLPAPEWFISGSVLAMGLLLTLRQRLPIVVVMALGAIAGLFHGYAYGETVVGAEMSPLVAYLLGFTLIQGAIAWAAYTLARRMGALSDQRPLGLRFAGFTLCGIGGALLSTLVG